MARARLSRDDTYHSTTPQHWNRGDCERRLFFQREAAETLIWLVEASPAEKERLCDLVEWSYHERA